MRAGGTVGWQQDIRVQEMGSLTAAAGPPSRRVLVPSVSPCRAAGESTESLGYNDNEPAMMPLPGAHAVWLPQTRQLPGDQPKPPDKLVGGASGWKRVSQ